MSEKVKQTTIAQFTYTYHPDPMGGTEVYVTHLSKKLKKLGYSVYILAPSENASQLEEYDHDGITIVRYPLKPPDSLEHLYQHRNASVANILSDWLQKHSVDIMHLHAASYGQPLDLMEVAKGHGIHVMMTYHTPTISCARGTLMKWGKVACDGFMDQQTCTACVLQSKRIPKALANCLSRIPLKVSKVLYRILPKKLNTLFRAKTSLIHWQTTTIFSQ